MPSASRIRMHMTAMIMHCNLKLSSQQTFQHLEGANAHTEPYVHCTCIKALQGRILHMCAFGKSLCRCLAIIASTL